jgi:hypothetical protein
LKSAAIGLRPHSGWAALVVIAGDVGSPEAADRRRIEIADPSIPGSKQPYHAAEELRLDRAERLLARCAEAARRRATDALAEAVAESRRNGYRVAGCALLLSAGRPLPELEKVLASHALIHAGDGEFFRDALRQAAEACDLPLLGLRERELTVQAPAELGIDRKELPRRLVELGRDLGAPWTVDQKLASLAAWTLLARTARKRGPGS